MTRLDYEPSRADSKLLLNRARRTPFPPGNTLDKGQNRLTDCLCCCTSPVTLYLHAQCQHNLSNCEDVCIGTDTVTPGIKPLTLSENTSGSCIDWDSTDGPSVPLQCSGGISVPPVEFDIDAVLRCKRQNKFRLDLCFGSPASVEPYDCNQNGFLALEPLSIQKACENWDSDLADFFLDFGYFEPLGCGSSCGFRIFIDQNSNQDSEPPLFPFNLPEELEEFFS